MLSGSVELKLQLESLLKALVDDVEVVDLPVHDRAQPDARAHETKAQVIRLIVNLPSQPVDFLDQQNDLAVLREPSCLY
jgi:hypothetical protein